MPIRDATPDEMEAAANGKPPGLTPEEVRVALGLRGMRAIRGYYTTGPLEAIRMPVLAPGGVRVYITRESVDTFLAHRGRAPIREETP